MSQGNISNTIEDLKSRINIVDVISAVVPLKHAGSNYKGVCPFHNEKTPSFVVSDQKQIFTCFGCGATGDVIEFEKRFYNLDFREAMEKLAKENGIDLQFEDERSGKDRREREELENINREAAIFFFKAFASGSNPGYTYMKNRGIEDSVLKQFGIGYADDKWDSLYNYFKEKGVKEQKLVDLGLISEKNGKYYDKFRNRVIFPILNATGKVIGFSGRTLGDEKPKYMNSPENIVFRKKNNLYAMNLTKQAIAKEGYAILVEGYMDVISLYQSGIMNVSASMGTALTDNQAKLLKRYTPTAVLSYDSDNAGRSAALRGIDILQNAGMKVKVMHVPDGKDPDEFIKKNGRDAFLKIVKNAVQGTEYKLKCEADAFDLKSDEGRIDYLKSAAVIIRTLSPVEADIYIKKLSEQTGISEGAIRREVTGKSAPNELRPPSITRENQTGLSKLTKLEATLLKALLINPALTEELFDARELLQSDEGKMISSILFEVYGNKGTFELKDIEERLDPAESNELSKMLENIVIAGNEELVLKDCITKWRLDCLEKRQRELIDILALSTEDNEGEVVKNLTSELMSIQKEIRNFRRNNDD